MKRTLLFLGLVSAFGLGAYSLEAAENQINIEEELPADSSAPTEFFGSAANASGGQNESLVEQNPDEGNPLGNPIAPMPQQQEPSPVPTDSVSAGDAPSASASEQVSGIKPIEQSCEQGILKPWEEPLPQPSDKIENELYQSGNDIIDVQAYPIKDVSTVTEPNIQPRIITQ